MSAEAPQLAVLATSREALTVAGEQIYPLPPLELPLDTSPFEVEESEAGALFATRAREAGPSFEVTEQRGSIAELCARLDANALAIELAAARATVMSPSEILARLEQRPGCSPGGPRRPRTPSDPSRGHRLVVRPARPRRARAVAAALGLVGDSILPPPPRWQPTPGSTSSKQSTGSAHSSPNRWSTQRHHDREPLPAPRDHPRYAAEQLDRAANTDPARDAHAVHYLASTASSSPCSRRPATSKRSIDSASRPEHCRRSAMAAHLRPLPRSPRVLRRLRMDRKCARAVRVARRTRTVADEALQRSDVSDTPGYLAALDYVGNHAFQVGDWERFQDVISIGTELDPTSPLLFDLRLGEAAMRGDFATATSIGRTAVEHARRADNRGWLSYMLSVLASPKVASINGKR